MSSGWVWVPTYTWNSVIKGHNLRKVEIDKAINDQSQKKHKS